MRNGLGDKVLGWFVVQEDEPAPDVGSGREREPAAAPAREPAPAPAREPARAIAAPQVHDARGFGGVYRAAGLDDVERERLGKVLSLLESLPDDATVDVKRSIVKASLEAFGVSIDRILATGEGALAALDGHVVAGQSRTKDVLADAESRIAKLTAEIDDVRRLMDAQLAADHELARAVTTEKARVRVVLEFFDDGAAGHAAPGPAPRLIRLE